MNAEWKSRYEVAVATAEQAAQLALRYFAGNVTIEWKADESPVTAADREAEALLRTTLLTRFPNDGFLGEEYGEQPGQSGYRWIIDPVDGTRNFVRGIPIWATLVGLTYQDQPIAGIVAAPALGQTWRALRGDGAYRGEQRIRVSDVSHLQEATLFYTSIAWFTAAGRQEDFLRLVKGTQTQRGFGDFYGHVLVAQGSGEVMIDHGLSVWDLTAVVPIVAEAGGRCTDWEGRTVIAGPDVIVTNGRVHEEVRRLIQRV